MNRKIMAIAKGARVTARINGIERDLQEGYEAALDEGMPTVADKIEVAQTAVEAAHAALNEVAIALGAAFNEEPSVFRSGGDADDKPGESPNPPTGPGQP